MYSKKSPGSKDLTGETFLVHSIFIAGKGEVYHMLGGEIAVGRWGKHTFGMLVNSMISKLSQIKLKEYKPENYLSWIEAGAREIFGKSKKDRVTKRSTIRARVRR